MNNKLLLFQTPSSKKKNFWHILEKIDDSKASPLCGVLGYWFGGYHGDKPEMTKDNLEIIEFDGTQKLCPSCVKKAYILGLIGIKIKNPH